MSGRTVNEKLNPQPSADDADASERLRNSAAIEKFFSSRLRLSQLRMLVAIADMGQLKRVADALHVTPPAISKQVAEIEESLRHPVLVRIGNRLEFTPVGELMARRAREILAQLERTRIEVDELCAGVAGTIGVGAVPTVAPLFLPVMVAALKNRAPNAAIRLYEYPFDRLAPMLEDGSIDLALARETTHPLSAGFVEQEVMSDPLAIVCGSQHRLAHKGRVQWKDLEGVPWILPMKGSSTFMHLESLLLRHGLSIPGGSIESMSWGANANLLQMYPYVALFPMSNARRATAYNGLAALPLSTEGMQGTIKAVWRKDNGNTIIGLLVDAIRQHAVML